MMSTAGRSGPPGAGIRGLTHQTSHSGTNISEKSRLTAYSGRNTCQAESRLACCEMYAYAPISSAITLISAPQVRMFSRSQDRRSRGTVVPRGSTNVVNDMRMMTRPPISRFSSVASMPNGPTTQPVPTPTTIMSAWARIDRAR